MSYQRQLKLPAKQSCFLFGARQVGKTTLVSQYRHKDDLVIDLLPHRISLEYSKQPSLFRDEAIAHLSRHPRATIYVDEIQKVPALLDEVHSLIESYRARFVLTGSSARKLKRGGANLLAGRALQHRLFPLTTAELGSDFDLSRAMQFGLLPPIWDRERETLVEEFLRTYVEVYLKEEIQAEGIVRNIGPFHRFLEVAAANCTQIVNFSSIARECAVSVKTVQSYYQILEDTFVAYRLDPFVRSERRRLVEHPRYYFFDPGITNALMLQLRDPLTPEIRGRRFEQFVVNQCQALVEYHRLPLQMRFLRSHDGLEIDLLLCRRDHIRAAVEIKTGAIHPQHYRGLRTIRKEFPELAAYLVVPQGPRRLSPDGITTVSVLEFLHEVIPSWA